MRELGEIFRTPAGWSKRSSRDVYKRQDLVFTANAGVVVGRRALVSRFRYPERQREEAHFARWFGERGYEVLTLDPSLYFEGAGDLLGFPDTWFGGYRQRSDIRAFPKLSEIFQREIIPLELIDSRFYHPVSYTHLDVYKRQIVSSCLRRR